MYLFSGHLGQVGQNGQVGHLGNLPCPSMQIINTGKIPIVLRRFPPMASSCGLYLQEFMGQDRKMPDLPSRARETYRTLAQVREMICLTRHRDPKKNRRAREIYKS